MIMPSRGIQPNYDLLVANYLRAVDSDNSGDVSFPEEFRFMREAGLSLTRSVGSSGVLMIGHPTPGKFDVSEIREVLTDTLQSLFSGRAEDATAASAADEFDTHLAGHCGITVDSLEVFFQRRWDAMRARQEEEPVWLRLLTKIFGGTPLANAQTFFAVLSVAIDGKRPAESGRQSISKAEFLNLMGF